MTEHASTTSGQGSGQSDKLRPAGRCATRVLKNLRALRAAAPDLVSERESAAGIARVLPRELLANIHRPAGRRAALEHNPGLAGPINKLRNLMVPSGAGALFEGRIFFVNINFTIQPDGNRVVQLADADVNTAIAYLMLAAKPISAYASQYGQNSIEVSNQILPYNVSLTSTTYAQAELETWLDDVVQAHAIGANDCLMVLNPPGVTNSGARLSDTVNGYHAFAIRPYCFVNVTGNGLTVKDPENLYTLALSHEVAEMMVDPHADLSSPEVCDPCGPNCFSSFVPYFGPQGEYLDTSVGHPPVAEYSFCISAIVMPDAARRCPAGAPRCRYAPPP